MKLSNLLFAGLLGVVASTQAIGGTIQIELTGVNINYFDADGGGAGSGMLTDAGAPADALSAILFSTDTVPVGTLVSPTDSLTLDMLVDSFPSIALPAPNSSTSVTTTTGGSLTLAVNAGTILDLDLTTVEVVYSSIISNVFDIHVLFAGSIGNVASQNLPFGLTAADPVTVTFTLQGTSTATGGFLTSFTGSGTGVLTAPVPVPGAIWLFGSGLTCLVTCARRRKGARVQ